MNVKNLCGKRFNHLLAIEKLEKFDGKKTFYKCECDCGNIKIIRADQLQRNTNKSCGCYKERHKVLLTEEDKRLYSIWKKMKERCNNPKNRAFSSYGGRGIKVFENWSKNFREFANWSMANGYKNTLSLDRIDVNGNYEPSNCRWATSQQQNNNKRNNHYLTHKDKTLTVAQWGRVLNIDPKLILSRLKIGMSVERALTTPIKKKNKEFYIEITKDINNSKNKIGLIVNKDELKILKLICDKNKIHIF